MSLAEELALGSVDHDELATLLASSFPSGRRRGEDKVVYSAGAGTAITLRYRGSRLVLREDVAALTAPHETVVWRDVFFNVFQADGYWRYRDDWQIVPAPAQAPRPDVVIADHPFIVELRVPSHPGRAMLDATIRGRRTWELQLILNLVIRGGITRFSARVPDHVWAYMRDADGKLRSEWVQPGYFIPDWTFLSENFTPTEGMRPLPKISDEIYRTRGGIGSHDVFEIPDVLAPLLDRSRSVSAETRDRFLRACYWYERSGAAWNMSVSLGHIAAVTAIETIMPPGEVDACPECGLNRAPGATRRFRDFIDQYAPLVRKEDREGIYELRSALVHRGRPFDIDRPGAWGALVPSHQRQRDRYQAARVVARDAIINWLVDERTR